MMKKGFTDSPAVQDSFNISKYRGLGNGKNKHYDNDKKWIKKLEKLKFSMV